MENREIVNLDFELKRHRNKSKLRETELLEALSEKDKEVAKLEKSLKAITAERLHNSKEELLHRSLDENAADENGKVCIKCADLQRLLEENNKVNLEFEKLTLEYENLKLNYTETEKENDTNKLKINQLEVIQEKEKAEKEKLLEDIQKLREKLENVQKDFEQLSSKNSSKNEECMALSRQVELAREEMVVLEEKFAKLETSWQEQQRTLNDIEIQYANIQTKYEHLQNQYDQLQLTKGQSLTDCQRLEKENVELQAEIEDLKRKVQDAQQKLLESNEKFEISKKEIIASPNASNLSEASKIQEENATLKQQLLEVQTQFDDLQREYDVLSNQLMDNLQENESLKNENTKIQQKLKEDEIKNEDLLNAEAEMNVLKSQLEKILSSEIKQHLKTPSSCRNSSMGSSGVCVTDEDNEEFENYTEDLLKKFCELSESLTEIELEPIKGKSKIFKSTSKNSTQNYKMYLRNILGVRKCQKEFDMKMEKIYVQGSFTHHSFHIMELSSEDKSCEVACDNNIVDINGCDNLANYIEKLKQEIVDLQTVIDKERSNNKSMLESTERELSEMREKMQQLCAELLEKSTFVENCTCKAYQQQIETLEKEKDNITIMFEELQEYVNCTLNESMSSTNVNEIQSVANEKLKELEQLKLKEQELLKQFDSQTKTLEELTQRYLDVENDLQIANEQLENQEKEYKEKCNQLQLEILEKLEISANEYRENMKKYNKEWEDKKEDYEQIIKDLRDQIEQFQQLEPKYENLKTTKIIQKENHEEEFNDDDNKTLTNKRDMSEEKEKNKLKEEKQSLQMQLQSLEKQIEFIKQENSKYCEQISLLNAKIITLEEQLNVSLHNHSVSDNKKADLESDNKELNDELKHVQQLNDKNQQLSDEVSKLKTEYKQLQEDLHKAEFQIQELSKEQLNREKAIQTLQNKLTTLEAMEEENKSLANEVDILQKKCSQLLASLNTVQENKEKTLKENEELIQKNSTLQEDNGKLKAKQTELLLIKCELEEKLQHITSKFNLQENHRVVLETQLDELKETNVSLHQKHSDLQEEKLILEEQLKYLKEKEQSERVVMENIESLQNLLEQREEEMNKAKKEKADIEKDLLSLRESLLQKIEEKQQQLIETEKEKEKVKQDNISVCHEKQELKQTLANANEENIKLKLELESLQDRLYVVSKENSDQQLELEKAKNNQNNMQKDLESFKESLSRALTEKQEAFDRLEDINRLTKNENKKLEKEVQDLNKVLIGSKEDKEQQQKEIEKLHQENLVAKESLTSLTAELEKLQQELKSYTNVKEEKVRLENTLNNLKSAQSAALRKLQLERDHLQKTVDQCKQQQKEFKDKEETLTLKIDSLNQQLHEFRYKAQGYEKLLLEHEEIETVLAKVNAVNQTLQEEVNQLMTQQENHLSTIKNLSDKVESLNLQLDEYLNKKKELEAKLSHLQETIQCEKSLLLHEQQQLKDSLDELKLKYDSLQITNTQLQTNNQQLEHQIKEISDKLQEFNNLQEEFNTVKSQNIELQQNLKATVEEAGRCSLALRKEIEQHKALVQKQQDSFSTLKNEMEAKYHSLRKENLKLSSNIEALQSEKQSLENRLREITVRNFEKDLQRQVIDATANTSVESNASISPRGRRSGGGAGDLKGANTSSESKLSAIQQKTLSAERRNRRLSTHDERRRQSLYWGADNDKETMTDRMDTCCNCIELDRKLKESERNLFIKISQVTALNMQLKNHPLKEENAALIKRLQEEQDKHRIEIKHYKSKLNEQTAKTEMALAAAAVACTKCSQVTAIAEQETSSEIVPTVVANAEVQTENNLSTAIQELQGKYNDLKNICRYRYNLIKELENKVSQKENSNGNSLSAQEEAKFNILLNQSKSLKKELKDIQEKYETAKKVLHSRRKEIEMLRAQIGAAQ